MPWCPKCKTEYREGFSKCADCGSELVDEETFVRLEAEEEAAQKAAFIKEKLGIEFEFSESEDLSFDISDTDADKAVSAFGEIGIEGSEQGEMDLYVSDTRSGKFSDIGRENLSDAGLDEISGLGLENVSDAEQGKASAVELVKTSDKESEEVSASGKKQKKAATVSPVYRDNAERASENRSSAWVLMVVGGVGIVVLILGLVGVIPLHFSNAYLFYGVMTAVFILFLVAGIISMKNALVFEKKAESENFVRKTLLEWCRQNLDGEELDRQIDAEESESEEILYFLRFEAIKARLNHQFLNLDQGFLEKLIDDTVYEMVYERDEKSA